MFKKTNKKCDISSSAFLSLQAAYSEVGIYKRKILREKKQTHAFEYEKKIQEKRKRTRS